MNRAYVRLVIAVVVAALALAVLARLPRRQATPVEQVAVIPVADLAIEIRDGVVTPDIAAVPKGHLVRLVVRNIGHELAALRLAGYESHVSIDSLAPGATWTGEFIADLPGDDFAWMVSGRPVGRLSVTGSHLVEGHR